MTKVYSTDSFTNIDGFTKYVACSNGNVLNVITGKFVSKRIIRNYYYVDLRENGKRKNLRLGRLIAICFISNPNNLPQVNHKDGNRFNDKVSNLEWVTYSENQRHKIRLQKQKGTYKSPTGNMKFNRKKIEKVFDLRLIKGLKQKEIAKKLNMGVSTVAHILLGSRRLKQ